MRLGGLERPARDNHRFVGLDAMAERTQSYARMFEASSAEEQVLTSRRPKSRGVSLHHLALPTEIPPPTPARAA